MVGEPLFASPAFLANRASTQRPRRTMLEKLGAGERRNRHRGHRPRGDPGQHGRPPGDAAHGQRLADDRVTPVRVGRPRSAYDPETGKSAPILAESPAVGVKRFKAPKKDDHDSTRRTVTRHSRTRIWPRSRPPIPRDPPAADLRGAALHRLRVGDAARVGRQHVKDDVLRLKTEKTRTWVALRVLPRLKHALAVGPKGLDTELAWITGKNRKAMDANFLGRVFGRACRKIGLDRSAHGLRKAAARRYIEAGAQALSSSRRSLAGDIAMVDKYTKKFNREKVALRAMDDFVLDAIFPHPCFRWGNGR